MKNKCILSLFFLFSVFTTNAQFNETIRTGRPGQAIGPFAVGKNIFQVQSGFDYGGYEISALNGTGNYYAPNAIFRFGLTEKFEINSAWGYQYEKFEVPFFTGAISGLNFSSIGSRINIIEAKNYRPAIGLQVTLKLPILSPDYNFHFIAPKIGVIVSQKIAEKLILLINMSMDYNGFVARPRGVYVANLSYSINDKFGIFAENYGDFGDERFNTYWDAGFSYLVNSNLQLDLYGGTGKNDQNFSYFTSIGFSWRFIKWHKNN